MAKEDSVYVDKDTLVFPATLDYVSVEGSILKINKMPARGDFNPAAKKGVKRGTKTR